MKIHTSNFKNKIKTFGRQIDAKITYISDGEIVELGAENLNSINPSFHGNILKTVMKELQFDTNIEVPIGTVINLKFGVLIDEDYEYLDFGEYIVNEIEKQEDNKSYLIHCYDDMLSTMVEYKELENAVFPMSVRDYITKLCSQIGFDFANKDETFPNYNRIINEDLYKDLQYTYRSILDEIAQVTASTICVNDYGEIELRYINETYDTIDGEFLKDINVNFGEKYGPVNSIVLSRAGESDNVYLQDEESIEENGLCEIKIVENQIMNFNDRSDYLPDLLNELNGLEYYINDFSSTGICYYDLCDMYTINIDDNNYKCLMLNDEINIEQGLEEIIFTEKPDETVTDYTTSDKTDMRINKAYILVDKQNKKIEEVVEVVEEVEKNMEVIKYTKGNPIIINDAGNYDLQSLVIYGRCAQGGIPTPSNPVPIRTVIGEKKEDSDEYYLELTTSNGEEIETAIIDMTMRNGDNEIIGHYELASVGEIYDTFENGVINKRIGKIESYEGEEITTDYISTTGELTIGATIYYVLPEPIIMNTTYNKLKLFKGYNVITLNDVLTPDMDIAYLVDSVFNSQYVSNSQFTIDKNNIMSKIEHTEVVSNQALQELNGKVSVNDYELYQQQVSTQFTETNNSFNLEFNNTFVPMINGVRSDNEEEWQKFNKYIRFVDGDIVLGEEGNKFTLKIENDRIGIYYNGVEFSSWIQNEFTVETLNLGKFAFIPRGNGSLSFRKVK